MTKLNQYSEQMMLRILKIVKLLDNPYVKADIELLLSAIESGDKINAKTMAIKNWQTIDTAPCR